MAAEHHQPPHAPIPLVGEPSPLAPTADAEGIRAWSRPGPRHRVDVLVFDDMYDEGWQMTFDEGEHLGGDDIAPSPHGAWFGAVAADVVTEAVAHAAEAGTAPPEIDVSVRGGFHLERDAVDRVRSRPVPLAIEVGIGAGNIDAEKLVDVAVESSLATLAAAGSADVAVTSALDADARAAMVPAERFADVERMDDFVPSAPLIARAAPRTADGEPSPAATRGIGLRLRADARLRSDGCIDVTVSETVPVGRAWTMLLDLPPELGGGYRAPSPRVVFTASTLASWTAHLRAMLRHAGPDHRHVAALDTHITAPEIGRSIGRTSVRIIADNLPAEVLTAAVADTRAVCFTTVALAAAVTTHHRVRP